MDLLKTRLGDVLNNVKILSESVAWIQLMSPQLRSEIIRDWIQKDQLMNKGVDRYGNVIGYYSLSTEFISGGRKQEGEHFNLYDTGHFYESMFVTVLADLVRVEADITDIQDQYWWRNEILELTDENLQKLIEKAKTSYSSYVRRVLGIGR